MHNRQLRELKSEDDEDPLPNVDSLEDIMSASEADSMEESGPGGTANSGDSSS